MAQVMVVDDEVGIRELLSEILADEGHEVVLADCVRAARRARERHRPDLVLLDIWMPDSDGITLLKEWAASGQLNMPVVMMSGHGTIETALEATRIGAIDFLEKPIALQRLLATVRRALHVPEFVSPQPSALVSIGRSPALVEAKRRLAQLAHSMAPLMLRGEPGMQGAPFARLLAPPGAAFLDGIELTSSPTSELLERAAGGILYLNDLTRLSRAESKSVDFLLSRAPRHRVRLVSFSPVDPRTLVERHELDPELVSRLSELTFMLPALRDISDDISELAARLLAELVEARVCPPRSVSPEAQEALRAYAWPGNWTELAGVVRDLALSSLGPDIGRADVERALAGRAAPDPVPEVALDRPYREARVAFERLYFGKLLASEHGSVARVADKSGLERTHLYRKLKSLGLPAGRREGD